MLQQSLVVKFEENVKRNVRIHILIATFDDVTISWGSLSLESVNWTDASSSSVSFIVVIKTICRPTYYITHDIWSYSFEASY